MKQINQAKRKRLTGSQGSFLLLFGLPTLLLYIYITVLPMLSAVRDSFTDWAGYNSQKGFVGLANYIELFADLVFYKAVVNDLIISAVKVVAITALALLFAVALTRLKLRRGEVRLYRYILYLPTVLPIMIITIVWRFIFNADGLLNSVLASLTGRTYADFPAWLDVNPVGIITFVACWCGIGYSMIVLIAAINNIPNSLYEAAYLDGAGQWKQFTSITLPGIAGQVRYVIVYIVSSTLASNMNLVLPFTNGQPDNASTVMGLYVYKHGLDAVTESRVGYANAAAVVLMVISFAICFGLNTYMAKKEAEQ